MLIRRATYNDIDSILSIVRSAQLSLRELGIDQWQDGYPSRDVISADIDAGVGYVAEDANGNVVGYEAVVLSGEEAYLQLPHNIWHTDSDYVVVHRLCVMADNRRRGIAIELMRFAARHAASNGIISFRIDTHRGNVRMLSLLGKLGFQYVGIIHYPVSGERVAYDLKLNGSYLLQ